MRTKQEAIEKSKFLGGDMEHTHLVKGLDYALLQKARSDIGVLDEEDEVFKHNALPLNKKEPEEEEEKDKFYTTLSVEKPIVEGSNKKNFVSQFFQKNHNKFTFLELWPKAFTIIYFQRQSPK
jgi:hypothetical protein